MLRYYNNKLRKILKGWQKTLEHYNNKLILTKLIQNILEYWKKNSRKIPGHWKKK